MRARKMDTEIRREQIARAALEIIGRDGVSALSIAGIASRIGVVPSALYRHYPGKAAVLDAVLDLVRDQLLANVARAREEESDALARLRTIFQRHNRLLAENRAIPQLVFSSYVFSDSPERKTRVREILRGYLSGIAEIVGEGQQSGRIRREIDPAAAGLTFIGMILPGFVLREVRDGDFDLIRQAEKAWEIFLAGIRESDGTSGPALPDGHRDSLNTEKGR